MKHTKDRLNLILNLRNQIANLHICSAGLLYSAAKKTAYCYIINRFRLSFDGII